jgi:uncharacterized protein YhfF
LANIPDAVRPFWEAYLGTLPAGSPVPERVDCWHFCSDEECANELGELCRTGIKTATASLLWSYSDEEPLPIEGQLSIITNWSGQPLCIIQTNWLRIMPYLEVDSEQAWQEGEGDRSLDYWRDVHWRYFSGECATLGLEPSEDMPVVCERFLLVYPLPSNS